jgi:hypothetical protein
MSKKDIEDAAAALVKREKNQWEDATVFVTDRVAFQMRNLIRILRKNYWGIFDEQIDPTTALLQEERKSGIPSLRRWSMLF